MTFSQSTHNPMAGELIAFRHKLHRLAELSGKEQQTSQAIASKLEQYHPDELITKLGGWGLAARFVGMDPGPRLMFRADMDALPISEINNFDHVSFNPAVSHKCGHDGHSTILIGLAATLHKKPPQRGEVILLFQPAEETGNGANQVIADPRIESIKPDFAFALHNLPGFKKNTIIWRDGTFASASVGLKIELIGRTAHASQPETGISPTIAMANIIRGLQGLNSLDIDHSDYACVTITHARLGEEAVGTAPGHAVIWATLRSYKDSVLSMLKNRSLEIAHEQAQANSLELKHDWQEPFAATVNHPESTAVLKEVITRHDFPEDQIEWPFRWSEDFGHFSPYTKICLFGLGAGEEHPALHNPDYDFPDELIQSGIEVFHAICVQITGQALESNME
jgi:amidohydrolase